MKEKKNRIKKDLFNGVICKEGNRQTAGITLIALVITIIVLLILAGITISQLGNSGLFDKAKTAKEVSKNAQNDENDKIAKYSNEIDSYVDGNRDDVTIAMTETQLRNIIQEEINKNQYVYPKGTRVTLDSGNFTSAKTTTASDDGWVVLRGYINNTNSKGLYLKVGDLEQSFLVSDNYTLAASLPCKKGDTITYQLTDWGSTSFAYLYFIPMKDNE